MPPVPRVDTDVMDDITLTATAGKETATVPDGVPSWMTLAIEYLLAFQAGDRWKEVVHCWMKIKKELGYPDGSVSYFCLVPLGKETKILYRIGQTGFPRKAVPRKLSGGMGEGRSSMLRLP